MSQDSQMAPLRMIFEDELPAEWKRPFAPKPDQLRNMAEQLKVRPDQVKAYVVFSGPQCKLSHDYVNFLEASDTGPGNMHVGMCIESPQHWAASRPPTAMADWAKHFKAYGFPPFSSLVQAIHGQQDL